MRAKKTMILGCLGAAAVLLAATHAGCDRQPADARGTLKMLLTDKPFPFDFVQEANVVISRVEVRLSHQDDIGDDSLDEPENDGAEDDDSAEAGDAEQNDEPTDDGGGSIDEGQDPAQDAPGDPSDPDQGDAVDDDPEAEPPDEGGDADNTADSGDDSADDEIDDQDGEDADDIEADDGGDDSDQDGNPLVTVFEGPVTFNLLDLQNGVTATLVNSELSAGSYSQIRLIVESGSVLLTDGRQFDLKVPSGAQTGIKLHFNFDIAPEQDTVLLMDIDVSKAFVPIPGGNVNAASEIERFQFKPSLAVRVTEVAATGSISGAVSDASAKPLADVAVTVLKDGEEITTTSTGDDGSYHVMALEPGIYDLYFTLAEFEDGVLSGVEVTAGGTVGDVNAELSPAQEP